MTKTESGAYFLRVSDGNTFTEHTSATTEFGCKWGAISLIDCSIYEIGTAKIVTSASFTANILLVVNSTFSCIWLFNSVISDTSFSPLIESLQVIIKEILSQKFFTKKIANHFPNQSVHPIILILCFFIVFCLQYFP